MNYGEANFEAAIKEMVTRREWEKE